MTFPSDFLFGVATSAYQVEGSPLADGAGPSIWHEFAHTPSRTAEGHHGDVACDHYHRYADDARLMRELGFRAYRFSISWSRVLPEGTGRVNQAGLAFYERLVDALLAHGIEPFVTLYHWDLPAALERRGGWLNRDVASWFAEYAGVVARALGERIRWWATLNEPWVAAHAGYLTGVHAPGHASRQEAPLAAHHMLLAHGAGVEALRSAGAKQVGLVVNLTPQQAASDNEADQAAARRAHAYVNEQYLDPALLGRYPEALRELYGDAWPEFPAADLAAIHQPLDFVGVNYYLREIVRHDGSAWPTRAAEVRPPDRPRTAMGWEIYPQGLTEILCWVRNRYGEIPIFITENGAAFDDPPPHDGRVDDPQRVEYLRQHLLAAQRAIDLGVNLRGYFAWSLLDNFEWSLGYTKRFGIVAVDFATQQRTPKSSALWLQRVFTELNQDAEDREMATKRHEKTRKV